jgi:16S rRNA (cytosine1402-N4)-methyltransferase
MQLDSSDRGFAYSHDAPLDMRMDQSVGISAGEVLNTYSHQELTRILREYGEEKFASRIAAKIIDARTIAPLSSTVVLANIVKESIPAATRRVGGNPAKRTFQALRIYVNNELEVLERAIPAALNLLAIQGRMVVLSYHSLEDRIVKRAFAEVSSSEVPHGLPVEPKPARFQLLTRASESASEAEISMNPRSQSVRIRAIERRAA